MIQWLTDRIDWSNDQMNESFSDWSILTIELFNVFITKPFLKTRVYYNLINAVNNILPSLKCITFDLDQSTLEYSTSGVRVMEPYKSLIFCLLVLVLKMYLKDY